MPATAPPTTGPGEPAYMLPGVNLFATGKYRGRRWTPADLRRMEANARKLGPSGKKLLLPPAVLGHDEDQDWLEDTGLPAGGWVDPDTVRAVPDPDHPGEMLLTGDVVNVPAEVAARIEKGEFKFGSVEIYDSFTDDFENEYGKTIRRFAFMGGYVPQVKRLGPLPRPVRMREPRRFAEVTARVAERFRRDARGGVHIHAEVTMGGDQQQQPGTPVDRPKLEAAVKAAMPNLDQAFLDGMSDDQLMTLVAALPQPQPEQNPVPPSSAAAAGPSAGFGFAEDDEDEDEDEPADDESEESDTDTDDEAEDTEDMADDEAEDTETPAGDPEMDGPSREEMIQAIADQTGEDPAVLEAMSDEDLLAMYEELMAAEEGDDPAAPGDPPPEGNKMGSDKLYETGRYGPPLPSKGELRSARKKAQSGTRTTYAEQAARRRAIRSATKFAEDAEAASQRLRKAEREQRRREVSAFCEQLVKEGRATPAQVDAVIRDALLRADNTRAKHKFSEGGRTTLLTEYEKRRELLARSPVVVKYGERFPGLVPQTRTVDHLRNRVERFAEDNPSAFEATGTTKKAYVEKFCETYKDDPERGLRVLPEQYRN